MPGAKQTVADSDREYEEYWRERVAHLVADPDTKRDYLEGLERRRKAAREHFDSVSQDKSRYSDVDRTDAQMRLDQLEGELQAIENIEWTREVTLQRREAWNTAVHDRKYRAGSVVFSSGIERDLGFTLASLKRQVQRWGLQAK
ncbi:MAG: hypothetical protein ACYC5O_12470 [Anaerolineae bacterium]